MEICYLTQDAHQIYEMLMCLRQFWSYVCSLAREGKEGFSRYKLSGLVEDNSTRVYDSVMPTSAKAKARMDET